MTLKVPINANLTHLEPELTTLLESVLNTFPSINSMTGDKIWLEIAEEETMNLKGYLCGVGVINL